MVTAARFRPNAFDVANYLFLALFSLSVIYPFWDMLMKSLKQEWMLKQAMFLKSMHIQYGILD